MQNEIQRKTTEIKKRKRAFAGRTGNGNAGIATDRFKMGGRTVIPGLHQTGYAQ